MLLWCLKNMNIFFSRSAVLYSSAIHTSESTQVSVEVMHQSFPWSHTMLISWREKNLQLVLGRGRIRFLMFTKKEKEYIEICSDPISPAQKVDHL